MPPTSYGAAICPWKFLGGLDSASQPPPSAPRVRTFAAVLSNSTEPAISLSQLPPPVVRGDKIYVKINESLYQEQLKEFKTNLIGRLLLRKGSKPLRTDALKSLLAALWQPLEPWRLVPLGKGYFDIHFSTEEDLRRVWGGGTCTLPDGIFCLTQWKPDFVPGDTLPQTHAQLWVRFYGLSQDYWHQQHLMEIARGVGTPLQIDKSTKERQFGYFARVLVDVDLAGDLPPSLMVERESHCFSIDIVYENMCTHCGKAGHMADHCRHLKPVQEKKLVEKSSRIVRQEYRPKAVINNLPKVNHVVQRSSEEHIAEVEVTNEPVIQGTADKSGLQDNLNENGQPNQQLVNVFDHNGQRALDHVQSPVAAQLNSNVEKSISNSHEVHTGESFHSVEDLAIVAFVNNVVEGAASECIERIADQVMIENDNSVDGVVEDVDSDDCFDGYDVDKNTPSRSWKDNTNEDCDTNVLTNPPPGFGPQDLRAAVEVDAVARHVNGEDLDGFIPVLTKSQQKAQAKQKMAVTSSTRSTPYPSRVRQKPQKLQ
ncbi:hypothetical protein ACLB2K_049553 [Fragaria x ananassa]